MIKNTLILGMTLALTGLTSAKISWGKCQDIQLQENFDATRYTGVWFEIARDKQMIFERGECAQARYTLNEDGTI